MEGAGPRCRPWNFVAALASRVALIPRSAPRPSRPSSGGALVAVSAELAAWGSRALLLEFLCPRTVHVLDDVGA